MTTVPSLPYLQYLFPQLLWKTNKAQQPQSEEKFLLGAQCPFIYIAAGTTGPRH